MRIFFDVRISSVWLLGLLCMTGMVAASPSLANEVIHQFDFGAEPNTPARNVLEGRSFVVKKDATDGDKIKLYHTKDALHIQVNNPSFGMIAHEQDIPGANHVRLHWGVSTYPRTLHTNTA